MEKCKFHNTNDSCQILTATNCDGNTRECSFFKTEQQYVNDFNHAVEVNRQKGNCVNCKYQKKACQLMEAVNDN